MIQKNPYMKPVVDFCHSIGVAVVRGAGGGNGGQEALDEMEKLLTIEKRSIILAVDGPSGPAFKMKKGAYVLAVRTGCPIVLTFYNCKVSQEDTSRWDKRLIPSWRNEVLNVYESERYFVGEGESFDDVRERIEGDYLKAEEMLRLRPIPDRQT